MNSKLKYISLAVLFAVSACSSESKDDETVEPLPNEPHVLTITSGESISVDEGEVAIIKYSISDKEGDYHLIETSATLKDTIGEVSLDTTTKTILYTAPASINRDKNTKLIVKSEDKTHGHTVSKEINIDILNVKNNAPTLSFETNSYIVDENSKLQVPFSFNDDDGDELTITKQISDPSGVLIGEPKLTTSNGTGVLEFQFGAIVNNYVDVVATINVTDGEDVASEDVTIRVLNAIEDGIPTIEIANGEESVTVNESNPLFEIPYTIAPAKDNPNANLEVSYSFQPASIDATVEHDSISRKIIIKDILIVGDQVGKLEMTVNDGISISRDEININFIDDVNHQIDELVEVYTPTKEMYLNVKNRNDELTIFDFYKELASVTNPKNNLEMETLRNELVNGLNNERDAIQLLINELDNYIADSNRDMAIIDDMIEKYNDLNNKVSKFGGTAIVKINEATRNYMSDLLPQLSASTINKIKINDTYYYSRYVGNETFGSFDVTQTSWTFSSAYKFMELVNILEPYCK